MIRAFHKNSKTYKNFKSSETYNYEVQNMEFYKNPTEPIHL